MAAVTGKTGAIVLNPEQWELLRTLAYYRAMHGKQSRPSVSETLRDLVTEWESSIRQEIASYGNPQQ